MKRLICFPMLLILVCCAIHAEGNKVIKLHFNENEFTAENFEGEYYICTSRYTTILKEDTSLPALPYICVYVLVGPNDDFLGHEIVLKDTLFKDSLLLGHNPRCVPTNSILPTYIEERPFQKESYPEVRAEYTGTHNMGGYRFLSFLVTPFRYDTSVQSLYMCKEMEIKVNLNTGRSSNLTSNSLSPHSARTLLSMVANPEDMDTLYGSISQTASTNGNTKASTQTINDVPLQYLIITCDSLASEFQRLAEWKTAKGVKTQVVTVEDIYSNYTGSTNQLKIKQAIKYYYDNSSSNLQYVLLGGGKEIVPVQNCYGKVPNTEYETEAPSDLFYACLQNINWDTNNNGIYGEITDNVDISPTVALARLPASTCQEAHNMIDKILGYERNPIISNWNNMILMCGADGGVTYSNNSSGISIHHHASELMYSQYLANSNWSGTKFRFYDSGTDNEAGANYNVTGYNLSKELQKGYSFVNVNTHGSDNYWNLEGSATYNNYPASTQTNVSYSLITTEACHTNNLSDSIFLGKRLMMNPHSGVVAYYGSSDYGFFNSLIVDYLGPSDIFSGLMLHLLLASDTINIGEAVRFSKVLLSSACSSNYSADRWVYFFLNTLSDPEMPVYANVPQKYDNLSINHNSNSFTFYPNVERNYHCLMSRLDGGLSFYESASDMYPSLSFNLGSSEYLICLSHRGYVPYRSIIGSTVYLQNESLDDNLNVTTDYTYIGSDVATGRTEGPVSIENGHSVISSTYGVTIKNDFEVKPGASLRIQNN